MVAGAAAGIAAVFKAPLTGVVFALEVPYRADLARRALLPTLVAAGSAYVVYVAIVGTAPLLPAGGAAPFDLRDLGGGLLVGLACGALARVGAHAIQAAKHLTVDIRIRVAAAVVGLGLAGVIAHAAYDEPLHLGPSYQAIDWARSSDRTFLLLAGLLALRAAVTWLAISGGAVGGLFIPLVTMGTVVGALFQHVIEAPNPGLFPTIGIAAFLGAGYRTPLAGVAFVAEATGDPGFLVPALLAAAVAQLVMGRQSFSPYQIDERVPDVTPLDDLKVGDVMSASPDTVDAGLSLQDCATRDAAQQPPVGARRPGRLLHGTDRVGGRGADPRGRVGEPDRAGGRAGPTWSPQKRTMTSPRPAPACAPPARAAWPWSRTGESSGS